MSLNPAVDRVGSILRQQHGCAPRAQTKVGLFQQSSPGQGASFRDAHMATAGMGRPGSGASRAGIQLARTPTHQARTVSASHQGTKHSTLDNIPLMTLKTCVQQLTLLCMWLTQCYHPACLLVAHAMPSRPHVWLKPAVTRCEMLKLKVSMPCPSRKAGWRCWTPRHGSPCQPPRPPHHQPRPAGRGTDHQGRCVYAEQRGQMVPRPRCSSFKMGRASTPPWADTALYVAKEPALPEHQDTNTLLEEVSSTMQQGIAASRFAARGHCSCSLCLSCDKLSMAKEPALP